jgi:hypothetical protein
MVYYIDANNGSDSNLGLSLDSAFLTLQHFLDTITITENTTVNLRKGTYTCDAKIVANIPTNITLTVLGVGLDTILKPTIAFGSGNGIVGVAGAILIFDRFVLDMTNMGTGGQNAQSLFSVWNLNNIALINIPSMVYSLFCPNAGTTYTFTNCVAIGSTDVLLRTTAGTIHLYNCYGRFNNGYGTATVNWNISNNVITTAPQVDANYKITDGTVASTVGVYSGTYYFTSYILLKMNDLYYSIETNHYNTVTKLYDALASMDFASSFFLEDLFTPVTINGETFVPIDKFDTFKIVDQSAAQQYYFKGLKSTSELVVANDDIGLSIASNIDFMQLLYNISGGGNIRLAFSIDNGVTWKTTSDGITFTNLSHTIPLKVYNTLTTDEITQWNNAKDDIATNGITPAVFNSINFNSLGASTIRFAYVLKRPLYADAAETTQLNWQFDSNGAMRRMKDTEYDIDLYSKQIRVTSLIDTSILKMNIIS